MEINLACNFLEKLSGQDGIVSSILKTEPVDCVPETPWFYNSVAGIYLSDRWTPLELLNSLQNYEVSRGRPKNHGVNTPRPIDLDILYFKGLRINLPRLQIPHPRARQRDFVMTPWKEIAGNIVPDDLF